MQKNTLVLGASPNPERFSFEAIRSLQRHNIPVVAIGRRDAELDNISIRKYIPDHIPQVHTVTLYLSAKNQREYYGFILSLKPKRIIFNPGTLNSELGEMAGKMGIEVVVGCMLVMLNKGLF